MSTTLGGWFYRKMSVHRIVFSSTGILSAYKKVLILVFKYILKDLHTELIVYVKYILGELKLIKKESELGKKHDMYDYNKKLLIWF